MTTFHGARRRAIAGCQSAELTAAAYSIPISPLLQDVQFLWLVPTLRLSRNVRIFPQEMSITLTSGAPKIAERWGSAEFANDAASDVSRRRRFQVAGWLPNESTEPRPSLFPSRAILSAIVIGDAADNDFGNKCHEANQSFSSPAGAVDHRPVLRLSDVWNSHGAGSKPFRLWGNHKNPWSVSHSHSFCGG